MTLVAIFVMQRLAICTTDDRYTLLAARRRLLHRRLACAYRPWATLVRAAKEAEAEQAASAARLARMVRVMQRRRVATAWNSWTAVVAFERRAAVASTSTNL